MKLLLECGISSISGIGRLQSIWRHFSGAMTSTLASVVGGTSITWHKSEHPSSASCSSEPRRASEISRKGRDEICAMKSSLGRDTLEVDHFIFHGKRNGLNRHRTSSNVRQIRCHDLSSVEAVRQIAQIVTQIGAKFIPR